jgi:hypothetical protein
MWPTKFCPNVPVIYDRASNPPVLSGLQQHNTAMVAAGVDAKIMANWFPLAVMPTTWSWLMNLPEGSIESWAQLCD